MQWQALPTERWDNLQPYLLNNDQGSAGNNDLYVEERKPHPVRSDAFRESEGTPEGFFSKSEMLFF